MTNKYQPFQYTSLVLLAEPDAQGICLTCEKKFSRGIPVEEPK